MSFTLDIDGETGLPVISALLDNRRIDLVDFGL